MVPIVERSYRALYRGILSRLPERAAVALGQWGLRTLPLDRLSIFRRTDPRLAVTLGGVTLPNPLILSSMYYDTRILRRIMGLGFGAVTAKSITRDPRPGHPQPNLVRIETGEGPGLVNCNGFRNPGLAAYRDALAALPHRVPLIVAAAGESVEEYVEVVAGLEAFGDLVEINISSPNTRLVYEWSTRPAEAEKLFRAVRRATRKPLIVKVSPDHRQANEDALIPAALDAGIGIVNCGNTRRVDEPRLSQKTGGLSGPALFSATLDNVRRLRDRFGAGIEIIACGGIDAPDKACKALAAGANACAYFTGFITRGPILARLILDALLAATHPSTGYPLIHRDPPAQISTL
jgi:dihydroorotate dehydrogenase (NAD+) catalytic subunit